MPKAKPQPKAKPLVKSAVRPLQPQKKVKIMEMPDEDEMEDEVPAHLITAKPLAKAAEPLLKDKNLMVRVRAAEFLGSIKAVDPMPTLYGVVNTAETEQALMIAFNTIVFLRDQIGHEYDPSKVKLKFDKGEVYRRVQYLAGTEPNTNY